MDVEGLPLLSADSKDEWFVLQFASQELVVKFKHVFDHSQVLNQVVKLLRCDASVTQTRSTTRK